MRIVDVYDILQLLHLFDIQIEVIMVCCELLSSKPVAPEQPIRQVPFDGFVRTP